MTINKYDARPHMTKMTPQKIDIQARKLYLEFALMNLDSDETSRDIHTAEFHRTSIPFIWAEWFGLASHFEKNAWFELTYFQDTHVHFSGTKAPKWFLPQMFQPEGSM